MTAEALAERVHEEVSAYVELRRAHEEAERRARETKEVYEEQRLRLWDFMESAGLRTLTHELGRVERRTRLVAAVRDVEALLEWVEERGLTEALTTRKVRQRELNEVTKEMLADGDESPPGVDPLSIRVVHFTRAEGG